MWHLFFRDPFRLHGLLRILFVFSLPARKLYPAALRTERCHEVHTVRGAVLVSINGFVAHLLPRHGQCPYLAQKQAWSSLARAQVLKSAQRRRDLARACASVTEV